MCSEDQNKNGAENVEPTFDELRKQADENSKQGKNTEFERTMKMPKDHVYKPGDLRARIILETTAAENDKTQMRFEMEGATGEFQNALAEAFRANKQFFEIVEKAMKIHQLRQLAEDPEKLFEMFLKGK